MSVSPIYTCAHEVDPLPLLRHPVSCLSCFLDNHVYGFDPHDDSDYLTISGNTCYDNGETGTTRGCDVVSPKKG